MAIAPAIRRPVLTGLLWPSGGLVTSTALVVTGSLALAVSAKI